MKRYFSLLLAIFGTFLLLLAVPPSAAASNPQQTDILAHGEYIANIAGCIDCHTPFQVEYQDPAKMTSDQLKTSPSISVPPKIERKGFLQEADPLIWAQLVFSSHVT